MVPAYYDIDNELRSDDDIADLKQVRTHARHGQSDVASDVTAEFFMNNNGCRSPLTCPELHQMCRSFSKILCKQRSGDCSIYGVCGILPAGMCRA